MPGLGDVTTLSAGALYLALFALVFVESGLLVGFFLPGDTVLFTVGLLAAEPSRGLSLPVLIAVVLVAAVTGDAVGYTLGSRLGRPALARHRRVGPERLARAERFTERYGWFAVVSARWIPWVRTLAPLLAGAGRMPYRRFLVANVVGAVTWGAGLLALGYLAASLPVLRDVALGVAATSVALSVVGGVAVRRRSRAAESTLRGADG